MFIPGAGDDSPSTPASSGRLRLFDSHSRGSSSSGARTRPPSVILAEPVRGVVAAGPGGLGSRPGLSRDTSMVSLHNHDLTEAVMEELCGTLRSKSNLKSLDLRKNKIGNAALVVLARFLSGITTLDTLDLRDNTISDDGEALLDLIRSLFSHPNLRRLRLAGNPIGDAGRLKLDLLTKSLPRLAIDLLDDGAPFARPPPAGAVAYPPPTGAATGKHSSSSRDSADSGESSSSSERDAKTTSSPIEPSLRLAGPNTTTTTTTTTTTSSSAVDVTPSSRHSSKARASTSTSVSLSSKKKKSSKRRLSRLEAARSSSSSALLACPPPSSLSMPPSPRLAVSMPRPSALSSPRSPSDDVTLAFIPSDQPAATSSCHADAVSLSSLAVGPWNADKATSFQAQLFASISAKLAELSRRGGDALDIQDVQPASFNSVMYVLRTMLATALFVTQLKLSTTAPLSLEATAQLAKMLAGNTTLRVLDVTGCALSDHCLEFLAASLASNWHLEELHCAAKPIGPALLPYVRDINHVARSNKSCNRVRARTASSLLLAHRQLAAVPMDVVLPLHHSHNLTKLDLSHNQLQSLPAALALLSSLRYLLLSHNPLTALPDEIGFLAALALLDVSATQLTELPRTVNLLTGVQQLNLADTLISSLPVSVAHLPKLTAVEFVNTPLYDRLADIPTSISPLERLRLWQDGHGSRPPIRETPLTFIGPDHRHCVFVLEQLAKAQRTCSNSNVCISNSDADTLHLHSGSSDVHFVPNILPSDRFHSWSLGQSKTGPVLLVVDMLDPQHLHFVAFWLQQIVIFGARTTLVVGVARPDAQGGVISPQLARQIMSVIYKTYAAAYPNINLICSLLCSDVDADSTTTALIVDRLVAVSAGVTPLFQPHVYSLCMAETRQSFLQLNEIFVEVSDVLGRYQAYTPAQRTQLELVWRRERQSGRVLFFKQAQVVCLAPVALWRLVGDLERCPPGGSNGLLSQNDLLRHLNTVSGLSHAQSVMMFAVLKALGMVVTVESPDNLIFFPSTAELEPDRSAVSAYWPTALAAGETYSERSYTFAFLPSGFFQQLAVKTFGFGFWKLQSCWRNGVVLTTQARQGSNELLPDAADLVRSRQLPLGAARSRIASYSPTMRRSGSQEGDLDAALTRNRSSRDMGDSGGGGTAATVSTAATGNSASSSAGGGGDRLEDSLTHDSSGSEQQLFRMRIASGVHLFLEFVPDSYQLIVRVRGHAILQILFFVLESLATLIEDSWHLPSELRVACPLCSASENPAPLHFFDVHSLLATTSADGSTVHCQRCGADLPLHKLLPELYLDASPFTEAIVPGQLERLEHIATGSNNTRIYRARWKNRLVAVKQIDISATVASSVQNLAEIRREMWLLSVLLHPNILRLEGVCRSDEGHLLMVCEYADEGNLQAFLLDAARPVDAATRLSFALQIASAMCYLHTRVPPVCHRDLKSPNVLVKRRGADRYLLKVADFGMARVLGFTRCFVRERSADGLDNCLWQAPEVVRRGMIDHRADIYAYGIVLWELLVRKVPFNEFTWMTDIADHILQGGRPALPDQPDCCPAYLQLMQRCWDAKRSARPDFGQIKATIKALMPPAVAASSSIDSSPPLSGFTPPLALV